MYPEFPFSPIEENGRDVIELHQVSIATTPRPLAESQDGFPFHRLTLLPGGRLKQFPPVCQLLTAQNCSRHLKQVDLRVMKTPVSNTTNYFHAVQDRQSTPQYA